VVLSVSSFFLSVIILGGTNPALADVDILNDDGNTSKINTIYDVGLTFGVSEAVSIWLVSLDRV